MIRDKAKETTMILSFQKILLCTHCTQALCFHINWDSGRRGPVVSVLFSPVSSFQDAPDGSFISLKTERERIKNANSTDNLGNKEEKDIVRLLLLMGKLLWPLVMRPSLDIGNSNCCSSSLSTTTATSFLLLIIMTASLDHLCAPVIEANQL